MAAKRNEPAPRPAKSGEWQIVPVTNEAARGWTELCRQVPDAVASLYDWLIVDPRAAVNPSRQGRLKGRLGEVVVSGRALEQWQYEITAGGRTWYCPEDATQTVWITWTGTGHPRATE